MDARRLRGSTTRAKGESSPKDRRDKQELKRKREQREKQKKDNELRSQLGTLVPISTVKMRKYSKKALRGVVKVDLDELKKKDK